MAFSGENRSFYSFHLNGTQIAEAKESTDYLVTPCIARDSNFDNYVFYFRNTDCWKATRKIPGLDRRPTEGIKGVTCFGISDNQKLLIVGNQEGHFVLIALRNV